MGVLIKTKYSIGDKVWYISNNKVQALDVTGVHIRVETTDEYKVEYILQYDWHLPEEKLFRSKIELIESL